MRLKYKDIPKIKEKLLKKQLHICPICLRDLLVLPKRDICLDHNHKTGRIRAVLCRGCNSMEGKVWRAFQRVGLAKAGIDYESFLVNLSLYNFNYNRETGYGTKYIHPKFKEKK
jgi:hypothetical protein